ncbi:MAG: hypothetical protein JW915_03700 [Chitinispirillaceae bacterium]|nr:hypothetical protein [Chitinispirillaceae bacterium]
MKRHFLKLAATGAILSVFATNLFAVPGTRGTPLGGMGTGYIKFDAKTGDFATSSRIPPSGSDMASEYPVRMSTSSGFHFFAGGTSVKKAKTDKEDAKLPLYSAEFGKTNNVNFSMKAFGPTVPGDKDPICRTASSPIAFFEFTVTNEGSSATDVAIALEFANKSTGISGLLGGKESGVPDADNRAVSFGDAKFNDVTSYPDNTGNAYLMTGSSKEGSVYSAGAMGDFLTTGVLSNSDGNCVAAKCNLAAGETVRLKFVISWWRTFISGSDRYSNGKNDEDNYYYHNFYSNSKEAANYGMEKFDEIREGINSLVNRVMISNFPYWYKDRLLNNNYPLIHNSVWTKDGRAAYWEGLYGILGTIDQGQHAAIWYTHNWPHNQWKEAEYWLRNQFQYPNMYSSEKIVGQIHHDFNISPQQAFIPADSRFMSPWDHFDRQDYFWDRDATDWSDLNAMLIFKFYELVTVTGHVDSLQKFFPKLLLTANRLVTQAEEANSSIPLKSTSSYDSDHTFAFAEYACGTAIVAYKAMEEMAKLVGDEATATKFHDQFERGKKEYKEKFFNDNFGTVGGQARLWQEANVAAYAWANYFCFEPIMEKAFIEIGCKNAREIYSTQSDPRKKLGEWHLYTYDHLGGALTAINQPDEALAIHKLDHKLYYDEIPHVVFWQTLFNNMIGGDVYSSYMTAPNVWRSYFQFMGYMLDKANGRLWIRPKLPSEMNKKIINAALPNPTGWGTLNYDESNASEVKVLINYETPVTVKEIILSNPSNTQDPKVSLRNDGQALEGFTVSLDDWGLEKNIRIKLKDPIQIGPKGLQINDNTSVKYGLKKAGRSLSIASSSIRPGKQISFTTDKKGEVTIELYSLSGAKIGTLMKQIRAEGSHSFVWDGKTREGKNIGTVMGMLRLKTSGGTVCKVVNAGINN